MKLKLKVINMQKKEASYVRLKIQKRGNNAKWCHSLMLVPDVR